jgi:hypothetical protein
MKRIKRFGFVIIVIAVVFAFSALSCGSNPVLLTIHVWNNQGAGIEIRVEIDTIHYGPYANGTTPTFYVSPGSILKIWDVTHGTYLPFNTGSGALQYAINADKTFLVDTFASGFIILIV